MSCIYLPDELVAEILSFLPVKSLMRLRCMCKSWKTLIYDSAFVKLHFQRPSRKKHIAVIKYEAGYIAETKNFPLNHSLENPSVSIASNSYYRLEYKDCIRVVGSCNGLLCLLGYSYSSNHNQDETIFWFRIWNPATRIISEKLGTCHQPCNLFKLSFSFGYDNSTRTYNAVVLCTSEVKVFHFGDNIWRKIANFTPYNLVDTLGHDGVNQQGVYLSGTVNWISIYPEDVTLDKFAIISLDLGTETYKKLLPPPGAVNLVPPYTEPTIATFMDRLCFSHHRKKTHFVIWQMIEFGFEQSWTQFLKISFQNLLVDNFGHSKYYLFPFCLSENGETLIFASCVQHKAILYNLKTNRVKKAIGSAITWCYSKDYVESLAWIC
ncbi:putative F-box domain-containing protein [Medicago truncatula]|uniref:F-box protein interaction domain protein n=1 Tax=Medicago truncatula TaxID=3880 RepID=G7K6B8_MEDTR|nr:F-box/kelch-repeat protein At3g23880 [Medicago truncatula]AES98556.1 F-box protein interaction domain protein [Medicago truncatula]RHN56449.1 putative F-box domain-containing protein [Medicago truncatula]